MCTVSSSILLLLCCPSSSSSSSSISLLCCYSKTRTNKRVGNGISHLSVATATCAMAKDVWSRTCGSASSSPIPRERGSSRQQQATYLDRSMDMEELLAAIGETQNEDELYAVMSPYSGRQLSMRFMVSLLSREPDWQRTVALLDWINEKALYSPSLFAYNVVLRNVLRAKQWHLAHGLFDEMRHKGLSPDRWSKTTFPVTLSSTVI